MPSYVYWIADDGRTAKVTFSDRVQREVAYYTVHRAIIVTAEGDMLFLKGEKTGKVFQRLAHSCHNDPDGAIREFVWTCAHFICNADTEGDAIAAERHVRELIDTVQGFYDLDSGTVIDV